MLILTRRPGEKLMIGDDIVLEVTAVKDGRVCIGISAPKEVAVHREEIFLAIQKEIAAERLSAAELDGAT